MAQQVKNPTNICEDVGSIPGFAQCVGWESTVATSCGVGRGCSSEKKKKCLPLSVGPSLALLDLIDHRAVSSDFTE